MKGVPSTVSYTSGFDSQRSASRATFNYVYTGHLDVPGNPDLRCVLYMLYYTSCARTGSFAPWQTPWRLATG